MSGATALILFFVFLVLMVLLSNKFKTNIGIYGFLAAFILAGWFFDVSPAKIVSYFPTSTIFTLFVTSLFFMYVQSTGVFNGIVGRILYISKGKTWLIPFALFIGAFVITALGGAETAPLIISPIAFSIVNMAGMDPLLAVMSCYLASSAAGTLYWTAGGSTMLNLALPHVGGDSAALSTMLMSSFSLIIFFLILFIIFYFTTKGHKLDKDKVSFIEKPAPFNKTEKFGLYVVILVLVLALLPTIIQTFAPNPVTKWASTHLGLKQACLIGILIFSVARVGNGNEILKNKVPWSSFIMIGGAVMIIGCAVDMGIIDMVSGWLGSVIPAYWIPTVIVLVCALMSFVSNVFSILPLLAPMIGPLSVISGLSPITLGACIICGCCATGLSPVSMGGTLAQIGATDEQRQAIFGRQWFAALCNLVLMLVYSALGWWQLVDKLFVK